MPAGWTTFTLSDLGGLSGGKTPSKANQSFWASRDVPWVSPKDMKNFQLTDSEDRISQAALRSASMVLYPASSILMVTRSGILQHTFPVAMAKVEVTVNQDIKVAKPSDNVDPGFLLYALRALGQTVLQTCSKAGTTVQSIDTETLEALRIPLPPLAEQQRIAQKLDALLAQVDTLKARIDTIPALIKRFRSAVLSAAINGELTGEKPCCWDAVALEDLVENSLVGVVRSADEQSEQLDGRHPYLKMNNINQDWGFNTEKMVGVRATKDEMRRYELERGDWLFNTRNSVELVGKSCVWNGPQGFVFNNNILRIRFVADALPEYVEIWFRSPQGRARLNKIKSATTSVAAIYQKALMKEVLTFPAISQQREIVQRVEQLFAFSDQLEARIFVARQRIESLTQSLLAKAFRGELVPQDPNDEPASVLLERIRAQRAAAPKPKRGRKVAVN
nr:restriction endonuclease subunit S [Luteimonas sp. MC1828]